MSRVALITPDYPPHSGEVACAADRLARGLAAAGVDVVVFASARIGEPAPAEDDERGSSPRVLRLSSVLEGLVMFQLEDRPRPFDLLHAITLTSTSQCLRLPWIGGRPVVATLGEQDRDLDDAAREVLARCAWVTADVELARIVDIYARVLA